MRRSTAFWTAGLIAAAAGTIVVLQMRPTKPVDVIAYRVESGSISADYSAEAYVKTRSVDIAPQITARVTDILVQEGDVVSPGQPVIQLYKDDLQSNIRLAAIEADVAAARAIQAASAVQLTQLTVEAEIGRAEAVLRSHEAKLSRLESGSRPEEIALAQTEIDRALKELEYAEEAAQRAARLLDRGAISKVKADQAALSYESAKSIHQSAMETLALLKAGPTREDVAAAEAEVEAAEFGVRAAAAREAEIELRKQDQAVAEQAVQAAREAVRAAEVALRNATLNSPFPGVIGHVHVEIGDLVSPLRPAISVVDQANMEVAAEIGDQDSSSIAVGQTVGISAAAHPGRLFQGVVTWVADEAVQKPNSTIRSRIIRAIIDPDEAAQAALKPGMEVTVHGRGTVASDVLVIPSRGLRGSDQTESIWVVEENRAVIREIEIGRYTFDLTEVISGLKEGDIVIISPKEGLMEGQEVNVTLEP
jgi:HlyD family secretion protein